MKTLYLECNMGAAGDMLMAALYELMSESEKQDFLETMNRLFPGVEIQPRQAVTCGITGTHMDVTVRGEEEHSHDVALGCGHDHDHIHEHHHEHDHSHAHDHHHDHDHDHGHTHHHTAPADIAALLDALDAPAEVKDAAKSIYARIADAEAKAHGMPVEKIHFHEVGSLDAVADVVGVCLLVHMLGVERIVASPVHVGSGQVRCAHGILPVPAPATAHILRDVPIYGGAIRGELCTPTGAALLKHFVTEFGAMPVMKVEKIGYGMGNKDFEAANCVRALLGETAGGGDEVAELCCNLDDMTAEALGFAQEELLAAGALDVYTTPIGMKKGRPAVLLSCMCRMEDRERLLGLLFRHTTTLGVRENVCRRYTLERGERPVDTPHGPVRLKTASGWGVVRSKPEYEDVARIARGQGISLAEVCDWLK